MDTEGAAGQVADAGPGDGPGDAAPRVLLVDDEPDILRTLRRLVERRLAPVQVDTAATAEEAAERVGQAGPYDMVVTDERLPGQRGLELLAWLRATHPGTLRVLITAFRESYLGPEAVNEARAHLVLFKPIDPREAAEQLRCLLAAKAEHERDEAALEEALARFRALGPPP